MERSEVPEMSPKSLHQHRRLHNTQCWWRHEEIKTLPHSWQELNQYNLSGNLGKVYFKSLKNAYTLILQVYRSFSSVQFSHSVMSDSLLPHELQHARPPCPSPTPGLYPNSYPLSQWCHPTIPSSVIPFSSCLQTFPTSGSFQMSQLFTSDGQNIGVSASTSVLPMNTQDWSPLGWTAWISLQSKGLSGVFSNTTVQKHQFFGTQLSI